jgi:hypothetical protein
MRMTRMTDICIRDCIRDCEPIPRLTRGFRFPTVKMCVRDLNVNVRLVLIYSMTHNLSTIGLARGLGWRLVPMTAGH